MDNEYLKRIYGLLESGATLGTGAVSGLVGLPYGLYKGVTSGAYGTPEAPRIAAREAQQFMERNTYQPRTAEGQENLRQLAGLLEASKLPPVMPEASLLAAIPKQAYAAQAERAGMAAEKAIEPVVTRTMERGGLPAQLLGDLSQGSIRPMDVWHGSPHGPFERFDPSKARTGEGNATFGEGAYLAQARETGESYKNALTTGENYVNGELLDPYKPEHYLASILSQESGNIEETADFLKNMAQIGGSKSIKQTAKDALSLLEKGERPKVEYIKPQGFLYKVDLPDESIAKMIDWDKPIGQQSKEVRQAIERTKEMLPPNAIDDLGGDLSLLYGKDVTPEQFLNTWESFGKPAGGESALAKQGITGIRYLDQESRNAGQFSITPPTHTVSGKWMVKGTDYNSKGMHFDTEAEALAKLQEMNANQTSNFVVFPEYQDLLTIKEINDRPVRKKQSLLD